MWIRPFKFILVQDLVGTYCSRDRVIRTTAESKRNLAQKVCSISTWLLVHIEEYSSLNKVYGSSIVDIRIKDLHNLLHVYSIWFLLSNWVFSHLFAHYSMAQNNLPCLLQLKLILGAVILISINYYYYIQFVSEYLKVHTIRSYFFMCRW